MTPLLKQIAQLYVDREASSLGDYCFVTPNKRSATFLNRYISDAIATKGYDALIGPEITTIDRFVTSIVPEYVEASRYEQLFTLYREYRDIIESATDGEKERTVMEFDRFRFWGDMLLSDFNEIDRYKVDASALFVNLRRLREIGSTFLTDEQRELIREYWGVEVPEQHTDRFWTHLGNADGNGDEDSFTDSFIRLWQILDKLYHRFTASLEKHALATSGRIYRLAADRLKEEGTDMLEAKRYIFVGFNALSTAELKILLALKRAGKADFYWDISSPALKVPRSRAGKLILKNAEIFPSLYDLPEEMPGEKGRIDVIAVPSRTGQAKLTAEILKSLVKKQAITDPNNAINTAIVLPDESLLVPMLHALPAEIGDVNVTMGFPMKQTPVASLIRRITSMHLRASLTSSGIRRFYYEDVVAIASHPLLQSISVTECVALNNAITQRRLFTLTPEEIEQLAPTIAPIFKSVNDKRNFDEVYAYVSGVLDFMHNDFEARIGENHRRELNVIEAYRDALDTLKGVIEKFGVEMEESTVFQLIESAIATESINFTGEPLRGLQIMGVLETRALDFDNVIIMSLNERIFPKRHIAGTFIPEALRRAYGMATADLREGVYAYYFYRLLSRAGRVTLMYDSRAVGGKSSEKSRYLTQLLYLPAGNKEIRHIAASYKGTTFEELPISVPKTPHIMARLKEFTDPTSRKRFSPSAINEYINCGLQFYLNTVEGLRQQDDITDYMDSSTYGTIVHSIVEKLYTGLRPDPEVATPVEVTAEIIDRFLNDKLKLEKLITEAINEFYLKKGPGSLDTLEGDAYANGKLIMYYIREMLKEEKQFVPFTFLGAEERTRKRLKINDSLTINYTQAIDRIDRVNDRLRIVDYKTGEDSTQLSSVEAMFTPSDHRPKAILQLFLYCNVYAQEHNCDEAIQPILYKFMKLGVDGIMPITISNGGKKSEVMDDYRPYNEEFMTRFRNLMEEIFDPNIPFTATTNSKPCVFCNFKAICGKEQKK